MSQSDLLLVASFPSSVKSQNRQQNQNSVIVTNHQQQQQRHHPPFPNNNNNNNSSSNSSEYNSNNNNNRSNNRLSPKKNHTTTSSSSSSSSSSLDVSLSNVLIPGAVLDDLCCRFIHTCPSDDLSLQRFGFQVEKAHWFYLDVYRKHAAYLPMVQVKQFTLLMFQHSPLLQQLNVTAFWDSWREYVSKIPIAGGFLLNRERDKVLMVRGCNSRHWGFPQGKLNQGETDSECALREIEEEVGYNPIEQKADWNDQRSVSLQLRTKHFTFFVVYDVDESFVFKPQSAQEIEEIRWRSIAVLHHLYFLGKISSPFIQKFLEWEAAENQTSRMASSKDKHNHDGGWDRSESLSSPFPEFSFDTEPIRNVVDRFLSV